MAEVVPQLLTTAQKIYSVFNLIKGSGTVAQVTFQMIQVRSVGGTNEQIRQYFKILELETNEIRKNPIEVYINGKRQTENPENELNKLLSNEKVLKIKRCAMSLFNYFPSGILSFFSMIFTNQCIRHEYIMAYTEKYIVSAEISSSKDCSSCNNKNSELQPNQQLTKCAICGIKLNYAKKKACFQIMIWDVKLKSKKEINKLYKNRFCSRVLKKFSFKKQNISQDFWFARLLSLWTLILKIYQSQSDDNKFYHLLSRNCKTFARASFYFLERKLDATKVFDSILGLFSDKPGHLFEPIQAGISNSIVYGVELFSIQYSEAKTDFEDIIKQLSILNIENNENIQQIE